MKLNQACIDKTSKSTDSVMSPCDCVVELHRLAYCSWLNKSLVQVHTQVTRSVNVNVLSVDTTLIILLGAGIMHDCTHVHLVVYTHV